MEQHGIKMQHATALAGDALDQGLTIGIIAIGVRNTGHEKHSKASNDHIKHHKEKWQGFSLPKFHM